MDKVQSKVTKQVYARKRIHRQKDMHKDKVILKRFENELQILKKLEHHHLVKVFASYTDRKYVAIIMKPVADLDLKEYLKSPLPIAKRSLFRTYYGCIASAVAFLHESKIRHKDIKPSNILLKGDDIYITDFGTAVEFDGDSSMTKGTVRTRTVEYQSPEVARGSKRGTASDIWSLGVTFLDMTTVLRGETSGAMRNFLNRHGTKDEYVFENLDGALHWTEHLRKNADYPRIDNSPMQWIKDMLEKQASDRPSAADLVHSIKLAEGGFFLGKCCRSDSSESSYSASDSDEDNDITIRADVPSPISTPTLTAAHIVTAPKVEQQYYDRNIVNADPHHATLHPRSSHLHKQVFKTISSYIPRLSFTRLYKQDPPAKVPQIIPFAPVSPPSPRSSPSMHSTSNIYYPDSYDIPGAFPNYHLEVNIDPEYSLLHEQSYNPHQALQNDAEEDNSPYGNSAFGTQAKYTIKTEVLPVAADDTIQETLVTVEQSPGNSDGVLPPSPAVENSFPGSPIHIGEGVFDLKAILSMPSRGVKRSRSDEHLQIRDQTKSLLEESESEPSFKGLDFEVSERRSSMCDDTKDAGDEGSREVITADLINWNTHYFYQTTSDADASDVLPPNEGLAHSPTTLAVTDQRFILVRDIPGPTTQESTLTQDIPTPTTQESTLTQDIPAPTTQRSLPENYSPKRVEEWNAGTSLPSDAPSLVQKTKPIEKSTPTPKQSIKPPAAKHSLISSLFTARNPVVGPPRLTGENLESHNASLKSEPPKPTKPPKFSISKASVYRKKVFDDTASSVPTSIMSVRTRNKLTGYGLMLPLQDRTTDFLGTYTKEGKADAVRMLLKAGCNPGTSKEPRNAPIFNVVRGASSRHTKCLRSLIEHGVNVNVKAMRTGRTPLLEAISKDDWSGYSKVIFLLIKGNADPNISDNVGDVPLLRLLGGGMHPLEKSRREALALLLCSPKIKVGVSLPGTKNKPLHLAIRRSDPWAVGMLLEKDDSVIESKNSEALTPLLLAASFWKLGLTPDQLQILDLLLEKGANIKAKMPETRKPLLHIAVSHGHVDAVERLLEHGADPDSSNDDGKSAKELAVLRQKQHRCVQCSDCLAIQTLLDAYTKSK